MDTTNENNNSLTSKITDKFNPVNHKSSVIQRRSIRPSTSLKKNHFKVRSLRLGKVTHRNQDTEINVVLNTDQA